MTAPASRRRMMWWAAAALLVLIAAGVWGWDRNARAAKAPATATAATAAAAAASVPVTTAPVRQQDVPIYRTGIGTVTAAMSVTVKTRIDGQLDQIGFVEGQDVKAGQLLAQLDPRALQAQLEQAQAQQAKDQAQLANARVDLQRYTTLLAQDAATRQQLDTQRALVAQLEAAVQTDAAQIDYVRVQLGYTCITAPISGRVGARLVDPGNIVHAADPNGLVVINQVDPISVVFTLPEDAFQDINRALHRDRRALAVLAYPRNSSEVLARGKLILLNNQIDTATGTVQLKAGFANPSHALWPGQYVNVRLLLGERPQALTVPAAAVQRGPNGTYAWVIGPDHKARNQPIEVAQLQDDLAVVERGLAAGERVVVNGQYKLQPGARTVEGAPAGAPAAASASAAASRTTRGAGS